MGPVGIYAVATEIAALPTTELVAPLGRACFSTFAAARNAGTDMHDTYLRLLGSAALIGVPAGVGISLVAAPIITLAFGDRWLGAIPLVQVLGCTLIVTIFGTMSAALLNAHAVLKPQFRVQLMAIAVRLFAMVALATQYGLIGAAIGASLAMLVENAWYTKLALRHLNQDWTDLLRKIWRCLLAAAGMAVSLQTLGLGWVDRFDARNAISALVIGVVCGALVYTFLLQLLWIATGRPPGAERDAVSAVRAIVMRASGRS
jgi:O-antigen/teichoic acid export membrane protein